MIKNIILENRTIHYELEKKDIQYIRIVVKPDSSVIVRTPMHASLSDVEKAMDKKSEWIIKKLDYFKEHKRVASPKEYVSGEEFYYLGRQYQLKVIDDVKDAVKLRAGYLELYTKDRDNKFRKEKTLQTWYKEHAEERFRAYADEAYAKLKKYDIPNPEIKIQKMKTRWGSCSVKRNVIRLNSALIQAPIVCIKYVIIHEMCHFKYPYHDKKFYQFMDLIMPDWKKRKAQLEGSVIVGV